MGKWTVNSRIPLKKLMATFGFLCGCLGLGWCLSSPLLLKLPPLLVFFLFLFAFPSSVVLYFNYLGKPNSFPKCKSGKCQTKKDFTKVEDLEKEYQKEKKLSFKKKVYQCQCGDYYLWVSPGKVLGGDQLLVILPNGEICPYLKLDVNMNWIPHVIEPKEKD